MSDTPQGDTAESLLDAVEAAYGDRPSRRQLAEWHRAGLLPRPQQLPKPGMPGTVTVYPTGTREQLLALWEIQRHTKPTPDRAWQLWWRDFDVPMHLVREMLGRAADVWRRGRRMLAVDATEALAAPVGSEGPAAEPPLLSDEAMDFVDRPPTTRLYDPTMGQVRKRVGRQRFPAFTYVALLVAIGGFSGYSKGSEVSTRDDEERIVEAGMGLRRARTDRVGATEPWLTSGTEGPLKLLSRLLRQHPLGDDLDSLPDEVLCQTRDEVRAFLELISTFSTVADQVLGRGAFGFSAFDWIIRRMRAIDQAFLVLAWHTFRTAGLGENMDQLLAAARNWKEHGLPAFRTLQRLRSEVPETETILSPRQMGKALRSPQAMQQMQQAIHELRLQHTARFDAFFAAHPEPMPSDEDPASPSVAGSESEEGLSGEAH